MAYRIGGAESTREEIPRCAREQLESAIHQLTERVSADPVEAVHDARKSLKKERSLLRMARGSIPASQRRRENAALRDAARRLSIVRDADVMIEALEKIADRYVGQFPSSSVEAIRGRLEHDREVARLELMASGAPEAAAEDLKAALARVDAWRLKAGGWTAIGPGLERGYRDGGKEFAVARKKPTAENLHAWRKRAKDLWYDLRLLEEIAPHTVHAQAKDAHLLTDLLGDDHDLAVLRDSVQALAKDVPVDIAAVLVAIDHRRQQLQEEAMFLGARVYAEKPNAFTRRMRKYWKAARAQAKVAGAHAPAELAEATRTAVVQ
ncbi:MAG: CHAD domain-containing protein [Actinomycetota bacterium]|nr:CHAD domain-containing protein [Actinomycetota bacterium]